MATQTISFPSPKPRDGTGTPVAEGCDVPTMRPLTGPRGTDAQLLKRLTNAQESLSESICSFWACNGPNRPRYMCTCCKCWAMREIGTVIATLQNRINPQPPMPPQEPFILPSGPLESPEKIAGDIVKDLKAAIKLTEGLM